MIRSDAELIHACLKGDEQAWQELVARYGRLVYSIPRRKGFGPEDSDDVFQTVFTIVYQQLPSLRRHESLAAWLISITQRQCIRLLKSGGGESELNSEAPHAANVDEDPVQLWERQQRVEQALQQLDPRCRELLNALFLDDRNDGYVAVAARLKIAVGSIGPTRARCFKKLEAILAALDGDSAR